MLQIISTATDKFDFFVECDSAIRGQKCSKRKKKKRLCPNTGLGKIVGGPYRKKRSEKLSIYKYIRHFIQIDKEQYMIVCWFGKILGDIIKM